MSARGEKGRDREKDGSERKERREGKRAREEKGREGGVDRE